jgi:hypothetical protein
MTSRTAWVAGLLNAGLGWTQVLNFAAATTIVNGNSVLDSADITNGTSLDIFADFSISLTIASSTIVAGANMAFWIYALNQDGTTYGDNHLTSGASAAVTPSFAPDFVIPCFAAATQTTIIGNARGIILPPGTIRFAVQNNSGFTLTAATYKYRSYNTNLNS